MKTIFLYISRKMLCILSSATKLSTLMICVRAAYTAIKQSE